MKINNYEINGCCFALKRLFLICTTVYLIIFCNSIANAEDSKPYVYRVGVNDMINISVLGHNDLMTSATISADGTISFPYLGGLYVKDKTLDEIKEIITKGLNEGYIKYPDVSVVLLRGTSERIFMLGELAKIGAIPFEKDITIVKALSIIGGIRENGLYGMIIVRRKLSDKTGYENVIEEELDNGILKNKKMENELLWPDDILIVERNNTFLIQGEVSQRGRFVLEGDMTVLRALLQSGGVSKDGRYGKVRLRRKDKEVPGGYKDVIESKINDGVIESSEVEDMLLQADDILIVKRNDTFLMQGEIGQRGRFVLEKDMTVLRAVLEAGGVSSNGKYGKIKIRRKQKGELGGYKDIAESRINDGVIENSEVEDMLLQADDILIIEKNKTYFIYGEATTTGEFVLMDNMTIFKALTIARGFTKWGSKNRVEVLRLTGNGEEFVKIKVNIEDVLDGDASADILLEPGDTVVVSSGIF